MAVKEKIRVRFVKTVTFIAVCLFVLAACCADGNSWVPAVVESVCVSWLLLVCIANTKDDGGSWNG